MKKKWLLLPIFILILALLPASLIYANPDEFKVSDYGSGGGSANVYWRGYAFTVSTQIKVTALIGGGTTGTFTVGLYEADSSTYAPTSLLASYAFTSGGQEQVGSISSVVLSPGKTYVIAQGSLSSSGAHYYTSSLTAANVVSGSPIIETWHPDSNSFLWSYIGDEYAIINNTPNVTSPTSPKIGFQYSKVTSAAPAPEEPQPWVRGDRHMVCSLVEVNENGCFEFVFIYEYADNNWVSIFNKDTKELAHQVNMPYGKANFEACLEDNITYVVFTHRAPMGTYDELAEEDNHFQMFEVSNYTDSM